MLKSLVATFLIIVRLNLSLKRRLYVKCADIVTAMSLLFVSYHVFNIAYPNKEARTFTFFQKVFFKIEDGCKRINKLKKKNKKKKPNKRSFATADYLAVSLKVYTLEFLSAK